MKKGIHEERKISILSSSLRFFLYSSLRMTSLLFGISLSALLSVTSLLVVLFRVSPLSSPAYALPAFFISVLLSVSSLGALAFYGLWTILPIHAWDSAKLLAVSLRQGILLGCTVVLILLFHLLQILTWWIALLLIAVFVLIELALNS